MITYSKADGGAYWDLRGDDDDDKPVDGIPNGSTFTEIQTGTVYMFSEARKTWYKW